MRSPQARPRSRKLASLPDHLRVAADELVAAKFPEPWSQTTCTSTNAILTAEDLIETYKDYEKMYPMVAGVDIGYGNDGWVRQLYERREALDNHFTIEYLADWSMSDELRRKYITNTTA